MKTKAQNRGFTLVELLVVIAIIGLLACVIVVSVGSARAKSRDARRISDMKAIQTAIELYKDGNSGNAPGDTDVWATDLGTLVTSGYLGKLPTDPKTGYAQPYVYNNAGTDDTYYIQFRTEQDSSLGDKGNYCATSANIEASAGTPDDTTNCSTER